MAGKQASLNEIMGSAGAEASGTKKLSMTDLPKLLGDGMPKLSFNHVGRLRVMRALKQRFGDGFRNVPGVSDIMKDFDSSLDFEIEVAKMKKIKGGKRADNS
jgi:hypothetical protein